VAGGAYVVAKPYKGEINICKVRAKMDIDKFSEVQRTHMYFVLAKVIKLLSIDVDRYYWMSW
jgi:hypothetical protein